MFTIFIVPNPAINKTVDPNPYAFVAKLNQNKFDANGEDLVQLWWYSDESNNVTAHRGPGHEVVSEYVPASWIADLKEGETRELTFKGGSVTVKANQLNFRYKWAGPFEKAFARVTA